MAFGSVLHNTAAAIVSFFAVGALANLFLIGALADVGRWITTGETYGWVLNGQWSGHVGQIATATLLWVALPLALGLTRTLRREVS